MATNWKKLKADQDAGIEPEDISEFESTPEQISEASIGHGRTNKQTVSIRLDNEIVYYFKSLGPGYQTKINEVLSDFVRQQKKIAATKKYKFDTENSLSGIGRVNESQAAGYEPRAADKFDKVDLLMMLCRTDQGVKAAVDEYGKKLQAAIRKANL